MRAPLIDGRDYDRLLEQLRELVPFYTPEWNASDDKDAGVAIMKLFAHMYLGALHRLNQVPDKNLIAFLNMLGLKLLPAMQASGPVTFYLSTGASDSVLVPGGTQVASSPADGGEPVFFETASSILATPVKILKAFSVNGGENCIFEAPGGFLDEHSGSDSFHSVHFELFKGNNKQEHILYLGHNELFNMSSTAAKLEVVLSDKAPGQNAAALNGAASWQYWNDDWVEFQTDLHHKLVLSKDGDEIKQREVDGIVSRWIRCVMATADAGRFPDVVADQSLKVKVANSGTAPDLVFYNDIPIDFTSQDGSYLFGEKPRLYDTVYISCKEAFSKPGSQITLEFTVRKGMPKGTFTDLLSWEYWNGSGWIRLKIADVTDGKTLGDSGKDIFTLRFQNPQDLSPAAVQGQLQHWIRCRITGSDENYEAPGKIIKLYGINLMYEASLPIQHCLTYNNLEYRNRSEEQTFHPFYALDDTRAMYLGFDHAPLRGPISIYFSLKDQLYPEDNHPVIKWEYYAEQHGAGRWAKLEALDGTNHLSQSGCLEFIGLPDFSRLSFLGSSLYWIRAVDVEHRFHTGQLKRNTNAPAPVISGIYLNTTMAYQAESYKDEVLGSSRGTGNQSYNLMKFPVITEGIYINELAALSEGERKRLKESGTAEIEELKDEQGNSTHYWVRWTAVEDLTESGPSDRHYEIDRTFGMVRFGDGIHGMVPPIGTDNIKAAYQSGGGVKGNVAAGAIGMLKTSIAFVNRVSNPAPTGGGFDTEMLESAIERGPQIIRHRNRAVTIEDYENLAKQASRGIARVKCLPNRNDQGLPETGWVTVLIVPQSKDSKPEPSPGLIRQIASYLRERAANVVSSPKHVHVMGPAYAEITVQAVLSAASFDSVPWVEKEALHKIRTFLHPLTGGSEGRGWEFGRLPFLSDFYTLLESIEGLDHVEKLTLSIRDEESGRTTQVTDNAMEITGGPNILVFSGNHQLIVKV